LSGAGSRVSGVGVPGPGSGVRGTDAAALLFRGRATLATGPGFAPLTFLKKASQLGLSVTE
jgi:hypothetical protein